MHNLSKLEIYFKKYMTDIKAYLPEDIITVDLQLLHKMNLLNYYDPASNDPSMTRYFHVTESSEKITLVNDDFVVWIVPEKIEDEAQTFTLIALNDPEKEPILQICFVASGVYNNSRLVLRVLEKFLAEIQENEEILKQFKS